MGALVLFFAIQLMIIVAGVVLNMLVVSSFIRRPSLRKKIPNILLFNQSIADLFNSAVYGVAYIVRTALLSMLHDGESVKGVTTFIFLFFMVITLYCSTLLYAVIASERFLSISFPLWHRVHVTKRHIWSSIMLVWLFSIVLAIFIFFSFISINGLRIIVNMCYSLTSVVVFIIIVLFITTFARACHSINTQPTLSNLGNSLKKQVRLTMIFFIMFIAFTIVYIPLIAMFIDINVSASVSGTRSDIMCSLLLLTSLFNPILTLCFKKEFRPCRNHQGSNFPRLDVEMHQI